MEKFVINLINLNLIQFNLIVGLFFFQNYGIAGSGGIVYFEQVGWKWKTNGVLEERMAAAVDVRRHGVGQDVATPPATQTETATLQTHRHRWIASIHVRPSGQISCMLPPTTPESNSIQFNLIWWNQKKKSSLMNNSAAWSNFTLD